MKKKLRYSMHLAGRFVAAGTEVQILDVDSAEVQEMWPNIKASSTSTQVAAKFDFLDHPTMLHISQIEN